MKNEVAYEIRIDSWIMTLTPWVVKQFFSIRLQWLTRLNSANHAPLVF